MELRELDFWQFVQEAEVTVLLEAFGNADLFQDERTPQILMLEKEPLRESERMSSMCNGFGPGSQELVVLSFVALDICPLIFSLELSPLKDFGFMKVG